MKYKIGDTVYIKSLDWYNDNKNYGVYVKSYNFFFDKHMQHFCGKSAIIKDIDRDAYKINLDDRIFFWEDYMFEDIKEIRKKKIKKLYESKLIKF